MHIKYFGKDLDMLKKADIKAFQESAESIRTLAGTMPEIAVILGSGLGDYAACAENAVVIPYSEIPHFPVSTVSYQKGEMIIGEIGGRRVLLMNGRFHYYEGWEMWETAYPVGVFSLLGIQKMIITNAAGGINAERLERGDLVCVTDHIKLAQDSPVRGSNIDAFGERFFDMQRVYDREMATLAKKKALEAGFDLKEGVYAYMSGPQYETPAEIRMLRAMGADLVGMSTVAEVIAAAQCGIRVLCISCVSNMAAGVTGDPITEEEVLEIAAQISSRFKKLVTDVIREL